MSQSINKTGIESGTKIATQLSLSIAFLGVGMFAAATVSMKSGNVKNTVPSRDVTVRQSSVSQILNTPDTISYGYYVDYMKKAGRNNYSEMIFGDRWVRVIGF